MIDELSDKQFYDSLDKLNKSFVKCLAEQIDEHICDSKEINKD